MVIHQPKMKNGQYTGDGETSQSITGLGFKPDLVIVFTTINGSSVGPCFKSSDMSETNSLVVMTDGSSNYVHDDQLRSLDADGFTVGDGTGGTNLMNIDGRVYDFVVFG